MVPAPAESTTSAFANGNDTVKSCFVSIHAPREGRDYATENKLTAARKREK